MSDIGFMLYLCVPDEPDYVTVTLYDMQVNIAMSLEESNHLTLNKSL